ncbi:MAG: hypothetical protein KatS3mg027_1091 [Bacteroidia bacterium]|nr:MAG: hypothetical protein KatS3mg027_1091 [Bacteroidia bacterium]
MRNYILILIVLATTVSIAQTMKTKKWRRTEVDSLNEAHLLMEEGNNYMAYPIFEAIYNNHPKETYLKYVLGKLSLTRSDKYDLALRLLEESYAVNPKIEGIQYDLARAYHYNYQFDKAEEFINQFLSRKKISPEQKTNALILKNYIQNAKVLYSSPTRAVVKNIGRPINTEWDEYVPVITTDEATMIFTYRGEKSKGGRQNASLLPDPKGVFFEDVYIAEKVLNKWAEPKSIETINTNSHDAAIAMSPDGQMLFIYKDDGITHGDIYVSYALGNNEFTPPQKLKGLVNSYSWEGSCSITADGRTLYFSSERPGGYGGKDIYKATLLPDSTWGNVVNLGSAINTPYDEDAPFIHPDGVTLYFSSKGHNSMGDYDIFVSRMDLNDSTFKQLENLGYPINTPADDIYFVLSASGEHGYYSSARPDGIGLKDIYIIETNFENKLVSMLVYGAVFKDKEAQEATITAYMLKDGKEELFSQTKSSKEKGKYLLNLPAGFEFKIECKLDSNFSESFVVNTKDLKEYKEKLHLFNFETVQTAPQTPTVASKPTTIALNTETLNTVQKETYEYTKNYGNVSVEGLIFKVQIAAYKYPKNYSYEHLKGLGKIETMQLGDGLTRFTIGGEFKTLDEAFQHNLKVIRAGQKDAFVLAIYKGKRVYLSDLVKMGIYIKKDEQLAKEIQKEYQPVATNTNNPSIKNQTITSNTTEKKETIPSTGSSKIDFSGINLNPFQQKIFNYSHQYGQVEKNNLYYSVQIGITKNPNNVGFNNLKKHGKIESYRLETGVYILYIGKIKTLNDALMLNKKIIQAGVKDAFVIGFYDNKRYYINQLIENKILE